MVSQLEVVALRLKSAIMPEDIFGVITGTESEKLLVEKKEYWRLARIVHEDSYEGSERIVAKEAFQKLGNLHDEAMARIKQGIYGDKARPTANMKSGPLMFQAKGYTYQVLERLHVGATCGVFQGVATDNRRHTSQVIIRAPHNAADNDLMERESRSLELIRKKVKSLSDNPEGKEVAMSLSMRLPCLLQSIKLLEPGGASRKVVNTFLQVPGKETSWFTLEEIRKAFPDGVTTRVMTFIWNRILEGLTLAHSSKVVHCALTPNHVLVRPSDHSGNIIDWTASCRVGEGDKVPYRDKRYEAYYPPEIADKNGTPLPASDVYMSAWCMVYILGGDPGKKAIPSSVEEPIREFLNRCLQPKASRRPQNGQVAWGEFREVAKKVFGKSKFVEFQMPTA